MKINIFCIILIFIVVKLLLYTPKNQEMFTGKANFERDYRSYNDSLAKYLWKCVFAYFKTEFYKSLHSTCNTLDIKHSCTHECFMID